MSSEINSQSTRLTVKDNFNSTREMKMSEFLKKINNESNQYYQQEKSSNPFSHSTPISNVQTKLDNHQISSSNSNLDYTNISKSNYIQEYQNISSHQFDKMVNQKVNTFENYRIPQSNSTNNKDYQQSLQKNNDIHSQKIISTRGNNLETPLKIKKKYPVISNELPVPVLKESYRTEIEDKRRLSNTIYQSLMTNYSNLGHRFISQIEIEKLLDKYKLNDKDDKNKIKEFVSLLKTMINRNMNIIEQSSENLFSNNHLIEKNTKENIYNLLLDTKDRDYKTYPDINYFSFSFGSHNVFSRDKESVGYINRNFNNIKCAELIEVIIPRETENGDKYELYPYLLIDIEEFGNTFQGTNESLSSAFGKISFGKVIGNFAYYTAPKDNQLMKYFNPMISLSKMTIRIKKPDGQLFNFGKYVLDHSNMSFIYTKLGKTSPKTNEIIHSDNMNISESSKIEKNSPDDNLIDKTLENDNIPEKIESNATFLFRISCLQKPIETIL